MAGTLVVTTSKRWGYHLLKLRPLQLILSDSFTGLAIAQVLSLSLLPIQTSAFKKGTDTV